MDERHAHRRLGGALDRDLGGLADAGPTAPAAYPLTAPGAIRLLSWNIHGGLGPDGVRDLARAVDLVRRHEPDIVALQEVDSRVAIPGCGPAFAFLQLALGEHAVAAKALSAPDGDYGHIIISRWPMSGTKLHDISHSRRERRLAIETTVETPDGPLHLVAAHLGLGWRERRFQAGKLAAIAASAAPAMVMAGDFNDWAWRGSVRRALLDRLPGHTNHRTFPARWPLLMLDRVYCRPRRALVQSYVDPAGRQVSDHLPVIADLRFVPDRDGKVNPHPGAAPDLPPAPRADHQMSWRPERERRRGR